MMSLFNFTSFVILFQFFFISLLNCSANKTVYNPKPYELQLSLNLTTRYEPNSVFLSLSSYIPLLPLIKGLPLVWMWPKSNKNQTQEKSKMATCD